MNNVWIVVPVISNDVDLTAFVSKLSGEYVAPETYKAQQFNQDTKEFEDVDIPHPYAGQNGPDFSNKIIFINKQSGHDNYENIVHIDDTDEISIYRYWNTGIEYAIDNGADSVVLLNGVIDLDPFSIKDAYNVLKSEGKEVINVCDGAIVMISSETELRADDQFQIWFGDNDLYRRAESVLGYSRSEYSKLEYIVDPNSVESFNSIVASDEVKYNAKWS